MIGILLCSYFGLDHTSNFEIIQRWIDDCQFVWHCFYVQSHILKCIRHTKILSKFQTISKMSAVESCGCLSELPETEFKGSVVPINEGA